MKNLLTDYVRYNLWANQRIIEMLQEQDTTKLTKDLDNSFPSILDTIYHIWDWQIVWLERLKGASPKQIPSDYFEGTASEGLEKLISSSQDFLEFVENQPESFFPTICEYTSTEGKPYQIPAYKIVHHVMNHATYHRGQIITMARQVGIEKMVGTDFISYVNQKKS